MNGEVVTAVPGSGKTYTLIEKCYDLMVNEGVEKVVAITFTERAASELMERLKKKARDDGNTDLLKELPESNVGTIHNFCSNIIRDYGDLLKIPRNFKVMDEMESYYFLEKAVREFLVSVKDSKNSDEISRTLNFMIEYFNTDIEEIIKSVRDILETHSSYFIKMQLLSKAFYTRFNKNIYTHDIIQEILTKFTISMIPYLTVIIDALIKEYQEYKKLTAQLDFDDLLVYTYEITNKVGRELAERFPFILIDEFQDTDEVQISIFDNFLKNGSYIFAVGDPYQSIYSFRGAHPDAQNRLRENITLKTEMNENRRSFSTLIKFYNSIFPKILGSKEMNSLKNDEGIVGIAIEEDPFFAISEIIKENIRKGVKPGEIAILARTGTQFLRLKKYLKNEGIEAVTVSGESILKSQEGMDVFNIIRYLADPSDKSAQIGLLMSPIFNLDVSAIYKNKESISKIVSEKLAKYRTMLKDERIDYVLKRILIDEGYLSYIANTPERMERNDRLWRIMVVVSSHIERYGEDIYSLSKWFENAMQTKESGPVDDLLKDNSRVKIMTIHQSKGLEFKVVIVYGMDAGKDMDRYFADDTTGLISKANFGFIISPSKKILEKGTVRKHSRDEELRVMYVAFTRAREMLYIILSNKDLKNEQKCRNSDSSLCNLQRALNIWADDNKDDLVKKLASFNICFINSIKTEKIANTYNNTKKIFNFTRMLENKIENDERINRIAIKEFIKAKNDKVKTFRIMRDGAIVTETLTGIKIYERKKVQGSYYVENGKIEYIM